MSPAERPLLVALRPLGLGDLLTAVPALRALAAAFPSHRRILAGPKALEPLIALSEAIDEVAATAPLVPLAGPLHRADLAVDLHGRGPASQRILLASAPGHLVAFANAEVPETLGLPEWREEEHEVERWCRMLSESGIPADPAALDLPAPAVDPPTGARDATLVHPGAAYAARRWPASRWADVAAHEVAEGRRVVVTGGPGEEPLAGEVAERAGLPDRAVLAGSTDALALVAAVAAAGRVVCGDTGVAHLATAMGTPSVVLFGPVPPALWGPPADRPRHRALWAGHRGDPHGDEPDPGLLEITVAQVLDALAEIGSCEVRT